MIFRNCEGSISVHLCKIARISFPIDSQLIEIEEEEEEEGEAFVGTSRNETLPERNSRGYRNLRRWNNVHDLMLSPLEARAPDRGNYRG